MSDFRNRQMRAAAGASSSEWDNTFRYIGTYTFVQEEDALTDANGNTQKFYNDYIGAFDNGNRIIRATVSNNSYEGNYKAIELFITPNTSPGAAIGMRGSITQRVNIGVQTSRSFYLTAGSIIEVVVFDAFI